VNAVESDHSFNSIELLVISKIKQSQNQK